MLKNILFYLVVSQISPNFVLKFPVMAAVRADRVYGSYYYYSLDSLDYSDI